MINNSNLRKKYGHVFLIYIFLFLLMAFVSFFNEDFLTIRNFKNLIKASFPLFMVGFGQTLIILTGGIDLSLGGIVALCNVVCVMLMQPGNGFSIFYSIIITLLVGLICGGLNGVIITKGRLAPIIVTIATTTIFDGLALLILPKPGGTVDKAFGKFFTRGIYGFFPIILLIIVLVFIRILTNNTKYGKSIRAIGGSETSAYSIGINVSKIKIIVYSLAGVLCALAGIFLSAQMNSADATIGKNYAMNAITATVVGGTAMTGTIGDPIGTVAGVLIISIINNMLNLFGVSSFYQFICQGLILIVALALSALSKNMKGMVALNGKK